MLSIMLDVDFGSVEWTPDTSDTLVDTGDRLAGDPLVLLRA